MRRPLTLLLLFAITLGVSAGPHPCHAQARQTPQTPAAGHASCHGPQAPTAPSKPAHDCCNPEKGGHVLCDQACQGAAVMSVASTLPAVQAFRELELPVVERLGALFVLSIDHVPLT